MRRALIDSGAIYAFVVRTDQNHGAAVNFVAKWLKTSGTFLLLDVVFFETMTLLKARASADVAIRAGRELRRNAAYTWIALTPELERETWAIFQKYVDKTWSFTDCALFVASKHLRIPDIFSFDKDFERMTGVRLLP